MQAIRLGHRGAGRNHFPEIAPLGDFLTVKIRFRFASAPTPITTNPRRSIRASVPPPFRD